MIDLDYNGRQDHLALQKHFTDWCRNRLPRAFDKLFEQLANAGTVLKLDRLDMEMQIDESRAWLAKPLPEITRQLLEKASTAEFVPVNPREAFFEAFSYFLEYGNLPWWSSMADQRDFLAGMVDLMELSQKEGDVLKALVRLESVKQRMLSQLPDRFFYLLLNEIAPVAGQLAKDLVADVKAILSGSSPEEKKIGSTLLKRSLLDHVLEADSQSLIHETIVSFVERATEFGLGDRMNIAMAKIVHPFLKKTVAERGPLKSNRNSSQPVSARSGRVGEIKNLDLDSEEGYAVYINNAGLVIVAGFLPALFRKLQLAADDKIADLNRAVCLVHYLATGKEGVAEFELGLAKILCGMEMEAPLDTDIVFSEEE